MTEQQIIETLATKVMGWTKREVELDMADGGTQTFFDSWRLNGKEVAYENWNPLQNIADAWQVVEKLESMEMAVEIYTETYAPRNCKIWHDGIEIAEEEGETAQEAICKAALEVVD